MEKITLNFSSKEKELLDDCISLTKLKTTPLLRALIVISFDELLDEIESSNQITLMVPEERYACKENVYSIPITIDEETQQKYKKIKRYLPVHSGNFTKMIVMPKLKNIQNRKQSFEEMMT